MNAIYDNQANTYDFFPLKNNKKRKLSELNVDELKNALINKESKQEAYALLDAETKQIMLDEIRVNIMTISRIKKMLKLKGIETNEHVKVSLDARLVRQSNRIRDLENQLDGLKTSHAKKLKNMEDAHKINSVIHHKLKDVVKENYGMTAYIYLIEEANRRADKELNNG